MKIQPNDKVVCINAAMSGADAASFSEYLVDGRIYSVREVVPEVFDDGHQCLYLVGITGAAAPDGIESGFCSSRFRKVGGTSVANVEKNQQEETK